MTCDSRLARTDQGTFGSRFGCLAFAWNADSIENLWKIPSGLVSGFRVQGLDCPRPVILSALDGPAEPDGPRVRRRTRTIRRLPAVEAPAAARTPEALVRLDDLRAGDACSSGTSGHTAWTTS